MVGKLPKKCSKLRSLFEYLLLGIALKLTEAATKAKLETELASHLTSDMNHVRQVFRDQLAMPESDSPQSTSEAKTMEALTQTVKIDTDAQDVEMVNGWRKIALSGAKKFKLKINMEKNTGKNVNFVAISSESGVNSETKYH